MCGGVKGRKGRRVGGVGVDMPVFCFVFPSSFCSSSSSRQAGESSIQWQSRRALEVQICSGGGSA